MHNVDAPFAPRTLRVEKDYTRPQLVRALRAATGREIKLRTLRAWERRENPMPAWACAAVAATLGLSDVEELGLFRWAGSPSGESQDAV